METHNVDTFEHDIANEIRQREASISDIASAVGDIGNNEVNTQQKNNSLLLIGGIVVLTLCGLGGIGYLGYSYYLSNTATVQQPKETPIPSETKNTSGLQLKTLSPTLDRAVGTFLTLNEKTKDGYILTIRAYSPVFSYMLRNERDFGDEIATAVGNTHIIKESTSTPVVIPPISTTTAATTTKSKTTGTSTKTTPIKATTTITATPVIVEEVAPSTEYVFSDVTVSNQNMRVGKSVYGTVVYAFIGTQKLIISSSIEGILALRTNTLKK